MDDALSVRRLPDGMLEVGVHIADVSHFVKQVTLEDRQQTFPFTNRLKCNLWPAGG